MATGVVMQAETVTRKEANALAQMFFNTAYGEVTAPPQMVWNGRQLTTDRLFSPIYVYNSPKGGFVIISAENKAYPILGYSTKKRFERDKLTDDEKSMLKKYAREIEVIRYDSRIPVKAFEGWKNIRNYVYSILNEPYKTDEYLALSAEQKDKIESIDRLGNQIFMPQATEFDLYNPDDYREITLDDVMVEEIPFEFYESFIGDIAKENLDRQISFDELIAPSKPVVKALGGGHFQIQFPENVRMMRVYAIAGMQMMEKYYRETSLMNLDMSVLASGYYVALAVADSGKVYGFKLYR